TEAAFASIDDVSSGLALPPKFHQAVAAAKREFLGSAYTETRLKLLKELIAKEPTSMKVADWSPLINGKLTFLLHVAEEALDVAREQAAAQRSAALSAFWIQASLLVVAIVFGAAMMLLVTGRVTRPLRSIRQAMLKVAEGDFSVVLPGLERK